MSYSPKVIHTLLGQEFYQKVAPAVFPEHIIRYKNASALERVGLEDLSEKQFIDHFGKFVPLKDNIKAPLALKYHGHQFQQYNPQLGDGRGFLYAQLLDNEGKIVDLGTKGSGTTPWSRGGDGRLTLKGAVREALATEYLKAQGVNTSETVSIIETGESLTRNDEPSPTRSAVLVRMCHSHIRIGTFQRLAYEHKQQEILDLVKHCLEHYFKSEIPSDQEEMCLLFFKLVIEQQAKTVAQWTMAGFCHGVLNSDNINVTGETFDFGPYRFVPYFDEHFTAAYFDHSGLYSFGFQINAVHWNLQRLSECFFSIFDSLEAFEDVLNLLMEYFYEELVHYFFEKMHLQKKDKESDRKLLSLTLQVLNKYKWPYEQFFFDNIGGRCQMGSYINGEVQLKAYTEWREMCQSFTAVSNIPRNMEYFKKNHCCSLLIEEIERIWISIDKNDNWTPFHQKIIEIQEMKRVYERLKD